MRFSKAIASSVEALFSMVFRSIGVIKAIVFFPYFAQVSFSDWREDSSSVRHGFFLFVNKLRFLGLIAHWGLFISGLTSHKGFPDCL